MKVVEIFESMQGEGHWMGIQCTFVRLAGCNLKCPFCDEASKYEKAEEMSIGCIMRECKTNHVVITGGEPTITKDYDLLITSLQNEGKRVHIETNGTNPIYNEGLWITVSPKGPKYVCKTRYDEMKLVVDEDITIEQATALWNGSTHIWLQPCDGPWIEESKKKIVDWIQQQPNIFRAGIQLHKWYEVV